MRKKIATIIALTIAVIVLIALAIITARECKGKQEPQIEQSAQTEETKTEEFQCEEQQLEEPETEEPQTEEPQTEEPQIQEIANLGELMLSLEGETITLRTEQQETWFWVHLFLGESYLGSIYQNGMAEISEKSIAVSDFIDIAFVAYHEVITSWTTEENIECQIGVFLNRVSSDKFPNSVREVLLQRGQYASSSNVIGRSLKSNLDCELEALEKGFKKTMDVMSYGNQVPTNVVFAATFPQGEIWKVIEGTYYCYCA